MNGPFIPLGKITVTTPGTTVSLAVNSGSLAPTAGQLQIQSLSGLLLSADAANTKNVYILPAGNTASANPGQIIAAIPPGQTISLPYGALGLAVYPENLVVDTDAPTSGGNILYGCGFYS